MLQAAVALMEPFYLDVDRLFYYIILCDDIYDDDMHGSKFGLRNTITMEELINFELGAGTVMPNSSTHLNYFYILKNMIDCMFDKINRFEPRFLIYLINRLDLYCI